MLLQIGYSVDDKRTVDKTFTLLETLSGRIKEDTSIINPVFIIKHPSRMDINYCYCDDFKRFYYVEDITVMPGSMVALHCTVDVLKSNANAIKQLTGIIDKQEKSNYNKYLNDGSFVVQNKVKTEIINFENGFNENGTYILICAGGNGDGSTND